MSDLIYTVAIGSRHRHMATMQADSLRRNGFVGRIACISDGDAPGCECFQVSDLTDFENPVFLRTHGEQLIHGFFDHDYILYLDADVLAVAHLSPILDNADVRSIISAQNYFLPTSSCQFNFTNWDIKQPRKRYAVCAGIVGFPGGSPGRDFYRLWHFETSGRRAQDETALNVVLHRSAAIWGTRWEYIPAVSMSSAIKGGECLIHYLQDPFGFPEAYERNYGNQLRALV